MKRNKSSAPSWVCHAEDLLDSDDASIVSYCGRGRDKYRQKSPAWTAQQMHIHQMPIINEHRRLEEEQYPGSDRHARASPRKVPPHQTRSSDVGCFFHCFSTVDVFPIQMYLQLHAKHARRVTLGKFFRVTIEIFPHHSSFSLSTRRTTTPNGIMTRQDPLVKILSSCRPCVGAASRSPPTTSLKLLIAYRSLAPYPPRRPTSLCHRVIGTIRPKARANDVVIGSIVEGLFR